MTVTWKLVEYAGQGPTLHAQRDSAKVCATVWANAEGLHVLVDAAEAASAFVVIPGDLLLELLEAAANHEGRTTKR